MGRIIPQQLVSVGYLITDLTDAQKLYLMQLSEYFDDNSDYSPGRQNKIGGRCFPAKEKLATQWNKIPNTIKAWFRAWESSGWIIDAEKTERCKNDEVYLKHLKEYKRSGPTRPKHYVFNVSKLCRLLDIKSTIAFHKAEMGDESILKLLEFALKTFEDDFNNPPVHNFISPAYKPNIIHDLDSAFKGGEPSSWQELIEKVGSPGEGTDDSGNTKELEGLSITDNSTHDVESANEWDSSSQGNLESGAQYRDLEYDTPLVLDCVNASGEHKEFGFGLECVISEKGITVPEPFTDGGDETWRLTPESARLLGEFNARFSEPLWEDSSDIRESKTIERRRNPRKRKKPTPTEPSADEPNSGTEEAPAVKKNHNDVNNSQNNDDESQEPDHE